jgi:hypothetical protein
MANNNAVIQGTYADFKLVKTRSVVQMVIEVPIEQASTVVDLFGIPNAGMEQWVAVAALNVKVIEKNEDATRAIQMAGMLCNAPSFGVWLRDHRGFDGLDQMDKEAVAKALRELLGVTSRTEMKTSPEVLEAFNRLKGDYDEWMIIGED